MSGEQGPRARLFVAILLPESVREAIARVVEPFREGLDHVRWVRTEQLHLTLRFIGDVDRPRVPDLGAALAGALRPLPGLTLGITGGGAFPSPLRPSVLWAGVTPDERLSAIHAATEAAVVEVGIEADTRDFHPHITVGRIRRGRRAPGAGRVMEGLPLETTAPVREVSLVESVLGPGGARHTPVARFRLAGE